jgi:hypothetical protein
MTKLAQPGAAPQQVPTKITRSGDGKTRVDSGTTSVITDPTAGKTILLDHLKKEAHEIPMQPPAPPQMPGAPPSPSLAPPEMPKPPGPVNVQDLGKGFIEGHEVDGKRYIFQPPQPPQMPAMPQAPKPPAMAKPGMPAVPQPPEPPQAPLVPTVSEIWTSTKLKMPVLTKTSGAFGEQVCHCKCTEVPEPSPAVFQVPPDYKTVVPGPPQIPVPKPPAPPKPPDLKAVVP